MAKLKLKPVLRAIIIGDSLVLLATAILPPIYALYVAKIGGDLLDASLTASIFAFGSGISTLWAGRWSDRVKRPVNFIILGYLITGIGFFLYLAVNSVWQLLLVQLLVGLAAPLYYPFQDVLYTRHINVERAGFEWSVWGSLDYFATAIGALVGGLIVDRFGFNTGFVFMGVLCLIGAAYLGSLPAGFFDVKKPRRSA